MNATVDTSQSAQDSTVADQAAAWFGRNAIERRQEATGLAFNGNDEDDAMWLRGVFAEYVDSISFLGFFAEEAILARQAADRFIAQTQR